MLLALRFSWTALWLILTVLMAPGNDLGGRWWLLLETALITYLAELVKRIGLSRVPAQWLSKLSGLTGPLVLIIAQYLIPAITINWAGVLFCYGGMLLLEFILPAPMATISKRQDQNP